MPGFRAVIVDATGEHVRLGVADAKSVAVKVLDDFAPPWQVAIQKGDDEILMCAGEDSKKIKENNQTLVFGQLNSHLPYIEDEELEGRIALAFWSYLCRSLSDSGFLDHPERTRGYIIPDYRWSASLLERFRAACATENRIRLTGFPNEISALLVAVMRQDIFKETFKPQFFSIPATFALITAYSDKAVDVCCFDYSVNDNLDHRVLIRDFFHTRCINLLDNLKSREWYRASSRALLLEQAELSEQSRQALTAALKESGEQAVRKQYNTADLARLKLEGAAYIARCCATGGVEKDQYTIESAYNIGVQLTPGKFQPILSKAELAGKEHFPLKGESLFKLKGKPENEMRISACSGYSDRIEESTRIAYLTLSRPELDELRAKKDGMIATSIRLDSPGSGEFILELLPSHKVIGSKSFTLPGLMI